METQKGTVKSKIFQSYLLISQNENSDKNLSAILGQLNIGTSQNSSDTLHIVPTAGSISIDEIRGLKGHIYQKPIAGEYKIIIIKEADTLTPQAQNALLKVLEEPPSHAIIILISNSSKNLLPTILSRVVTVNLLEKTANHPQETAKTDGQTLERVLQGAFREEPKNWIDKQLIAAYQDLVKNITDRGQRQKRLKFLESAGETKKMIAANVNAKFALANLILGTFHNK